MGHYLTDLIIRGIKVENRINWSDQQWAKHLDIAVTDVRRVRNYIQENYHAEITRNTETNKFAVTLYKYNISRSGFKVLNS